MLKNPPFSGNFPLLRGFNASVWTGTPPGCEGVTPRGHNGIDFGLPPLTPILAVDAGTVVAVQHDSTGYGNYILLRHQWGQSLYAQLNQPKVRLGDAVSAAMEIAVSGATGATDTPHLHFGIRIIPFSTADGWCGFSDPAPYLAHLHKAKGPLVGPHIIGGILPHLPLLKVWQPRLITLLDPNPEEVRLLRQACPDSHLVARLYVPESEIESRVRQGPGEAARWAHEKIMARMTPDVDFWQFANEILQSPSDLPLLNEFELARMALGDASRYRCAILAFSVGNPDLPRQDRMLLWRSLYPALEHAEKQGHIVAVHQYGMPTLWGPEDAFDWYIHRLEHQVLRRLPFKRLQFAVTEFGIDGLIRNNNPSGWQLYTNADDYAAQIKVASRYLERFSGRVLGYSLFTLGHNAPWESYEIAGNVATDLAHSLPRGRLSDINTHVPALMPKETDMATSPGPAVPLPPAASSGNLPAAQAAFHRRIAPQFATYNMSIRGFDTRPDQPSGDIVYIVKDIFMTFNGLWENSSGDNSAPEWARADYLRDSFTEAGADHHLFAAVIGLDGELIKDHEISFWSDGFERLGDPTYEGYIRVKTKSDSGWSNLFMVASSQFAPDRGESGPWCWTPSGAAEVVTGGGLPLNHAVSTFVVWQAMKHTDWLALNQPGEEPGTDENDNPEAPTEQPPTLTPTIDRRVSEWAIQYNLNVKPLQALPATAQSDTAFLVKDIFTTRNGSWEPDDQPGSVPVWARDAYLTAVGAPNHFDDAGGDHHLFAAVIGLDGRLLRAQEIIFWSDGFEMLADAEYEGFVRRTTKERSGWANIITGPGSSFVPERGESGPWCWAPAGKAEVVCGGGLPANHHISMFIVWQEVKLSSPGAGSGDDTGGSHDPDDNHDDGNNNNDTSDLDESIYMPSIINNSSPPLPPASDSPLSAGMELSLRRAAWSKIGLEYPQEASLLEFARLQRLGAPVTAEFIVGEYRVQGFQFGLVYLDRQRLRAPGVLPW
jgi:hypothetical protein